MRHDRQVYSALGLLVLLGGCTAPNNTDSTVGDSPVVDLQAEPLAKTVSEHALHSESAEVVADAGATPPQAYANKSRVASAPMVRSRMMQPQPYPQPTLRPPQVAVDSENYQSLDDNALLLTQDKPVSTFSIDVDTGSYSNVRRILNNGRLPQKDAVRVEELVNYFNYGYAPPKNSAQPFSVITEVAPAPWNADRKLLHIGLKGYDVPANDLPPANLVFLIDVSGSMDSPDKLGLLKQGFKLLTKQLRPQDSIAIAAYAGASGVVLEPTSGDKTLDIQRAIEKLKASGSTNGAEGIELAYQLAKANFKKNGINRVLLATDGDFNVGTVNFEALIDLIEKKRKQGIALTTLGFGAGNYNDKLMEQLADKGNGNYAYIDNLQEARKVLVESIGGTLKTIASDVKIQLEFNPKLVRGYRLLGYENRMLRREDFNNDKVDAGEIGAGHTVTALYELEMHNAEKPSSDPLRYGNTKAASSSVNANELGFLKLRYKLPGKETSTLISTPLLRSQQVNQLKSSSDNFRFSAAVAAFGQKLRGGKHINGYSYDDIITLGVNAKGKDTWGYRSEFINLVRLAKELDK